MSDDAIITLLVLGAALLHATWNAMIKAGRDRLVVMVLMSSTSMVSGVVLATQVPLPGSPSWRWLLLSALVHLAYRSSLVWAYRLGDLSHVYPLARGSAPLLLALVALLGVEAAPGFFTLLGVTVISVAIASLVLERGWPRAGERAAVGVALLIGLLIACYTLSDALGVRSAESRLGYIAWLFILDGLPWVIMLVWLALRRPERLPRRDIVTGVTGGALSMVAYTIVVWALSLRGMASVSALRESSVIFAVLIGTLRLGEPFGQRRLLAAAGVVLGVVLLHL